MASIRLLLASMALLAVPLASAAPLDNAEASAGAEVCRGHNPGIHVWAGPYDSGCKEFGPPPSAAASVPEPVAFHDCIGGGVTVVVYGRVTAECVGSDPRDQPLPVQTCGDVGVRVEHPWVSPDCVHIVTVYACPGGGGYVAVLGVPLGECRPCCEPSPIAFSAQDPVEVEQCDHWGNRVVVLDKFRTPCITSGCSPTCAAAADAAAPYRVYGCLNGGLGVEVYGVYDTGCIPVGGCSIHCAAGAGTIDPFPLWRAGSCPDGQGSRIHATGENIVVVDCAERPVNVDLRCMDPGYGVQVFVGGKAATDCIPLPHGV